MKKRLIIVKSENIGNRIVLEIDPPATRFYWGHGNTTFLCGNCDTTLAKDVMPNDFLGKLFKCNACECINMVPLK